MIHGDSKDGLAALTGGPSIALDHKESDVETLWNLLLHHDSQGDYMQVNTDGVNDQVQNSVGAAMNHVFSVLKAQELSNGVQLIQLRNPWGKEKYHGPWSDESELWTEELAEEVDLVVDNNDGLFWTDIDTYIDNFAETTISYDATNWSTSKFLKINDQTDKAGKKPTCGETCTAHEFKLTSDVDQKVFITAHTW